MGHHRNPDKLVDKFRARQQNIVFPDTVRNGRLVDLFLWKGSPNPGLVQRIAAWIFGLAFMGFGGEFLYYAVEERVENGFSIGIVMLAAMSLAAVLLGLA
jgi:hypothetical protein